MKSMLKLLVLATVCCFNTVAANAADAAKEKSDVPAALQYTMKGLDGKPVELEKYEGKVVLIVNVASKCGLTDSNYKGLQEIYAKYKDKGLVVLGFPCNQFNGQEPGSSKEISEFCSNEYGVAFDLFEKVEVNGDQACDLYKYLTALKLKPKGDGKVSWNFEKFLLNREGTPVARFAPNIKPTADEMIQQIEKLLAQK